MFSGRRITITREGWYYLFVALFISGGAVGGEVNLMLLLSGIMVAPLLLHWRILSVSLQRLDLERRVPAHVHAGDPLRVHRPLRIQARSRRDDLAADSAGLHRAHNGIGSGLTTR